MVDFNGAQKTKPSIELGFIARVMISAFAEITRAYFLAGAAVAAAGATATAGAAGGG